MYEIGFLLLAVLVLGYLFRHRWQTKKNKESRARTAPPKASPFKAVSIECTGFPCKAAAQLSGKRFLPQDAPCLPLATCDNPDCKCRYMHHEDRRTPGTGRRIHVGLITDLYGHNGEAERRKNPAGRRYMDTYKLG
ncbi:hypothetical protein KDN34_03710 [Shewanella yunxiaonensis]|uniref:Uncharacterized protein n=1 Tax=Shewanella yunxiaonensis TaxID=2829809 RepID=A0ABX7YUV2_9GAMM|nr:hypothetical protein [Shewanella yunxiaonensis]QUN06573.1 hypothetical protein KDN34_03710 [Shewanella yunxiaonensis]